MHLKIFIPQQHIIRKPQAPLLSLRPPWPSPFPRALPPGGCAAVQIRLRHVTLLTTPQLSLLCAGPQPICVIQTMASVLLSPPSPTHPPLPTPLPPPLPSHRRAAKVHVICLYVWRLKDSNWCKVSEIQHAAFLF